MTIQTVQTILSYLSVTYIISIISIFFAFGVPFCYGTVIPPIKQVSQDLQNVKINFKNRFKEGSLYGRFRAILCMYKVNPKANPIILLLIII